MGGGWQQPAGYNWQQAQPKPQSGMPHSSPQNRPNYNVSFSAMPSGQSERGKGSANLGKDDDASLVKDHLPVLSYCLGSYV